MKKEMFIYFQSAPQNNYRAGKSYFTAEKTDWQIEPWLNEWSEVTLSGAI